MKSKRNFFVLCKKIITFFTGAIVFYLLGGFFICLILMNAKPASATNSLSINEFAPSADAEWVELANNTSSSIDLSDWFLVFNGEEFSLSGIIPAHGLFVVSNELFSNKFDNAGGLLILKQAEDVASSWSFGATSTTSSLHTDSTLCADQSIVLDRAREQLSISNNPTKGWFNADSGKITFNSLRQKISKSFSNSLVNVLPNDDLTHLHHLEFIDSNLFGGLSFGGSIKFNRPKFFVSFIKLIR